MSSYQTEEEQVEALKKWWQENGRSVIAGVVLGLAVVGGGKGWVEYNKNQAEEASARYEEFLISTRTGNLEAAAAKADGLITESASSAYAAFAAMEMARLQYKEGNKEQARSRLQWVIDNSEQEATRQVAKLRMARLLLDMEQLDEAASVAASVTSGEFAGEFSVVAGDVAMAKGDAAAAKTAYEKARDQGVADESLLRMKLASVGG